MSKTKTEIKEETINAEDLDQLLGIPGAESVLVDDEEKTTKKPNLFTTDKVDTSFLNDDLNNKDDQQEDTQDDDKDDEQENTKKNKELNKKELNNLLELKQEEDDDNESTFVDAASKLIEEGVLLPFDDDKSLSDYTTDDFKELIQENIKNKEEEYRKNTPKEFFEALPTELQYAAKYVAEGGTDLKSLFKSLSDVEETKNLDISTEKGAENAIREYLRATNFGDDEDIQEEIDTWKDLGVLEKKAGKFKPKLDKMQEQVVEQKIKEQEIKRQKQEEATKEYTNDVYKVIEKGEIDGLKLNPKVQNMLFTGLTQANYTSVNGKPTNLLGHLLEKHQFIEPKHDLIAEALWLLADPKGYKENLSKNIETNVTKKTVRELKTEEASKNKSSQQEFKAPDKQKIKRSVKQRNFFKR